jgi:preprotein translocase subunit SecB
MIIEFANLQLEGYYVDHVHCSARRVDEQLPNIALTPGLHVQTKKPIGNRPYNVLFNIEGGQHEKDPSRFMVILRVESDEAEENQCPYLFDVTLVGYFRSQVRPSSTLKPYLVANAAMILYSSARELLASITGRGPFPALVLPTMHFGIDDEVKLSRTKKALVEKRPTKKLAARTSRVAAKKR